MSYKEIDDLRLGLVTDLPSRKIKDGSSPNLSGVYIKNGEIVSDWGTTPYPTAGALKTNKVHGIPLTIKQYKLLNGTSHLICLTTTNAYEYNTSTQTWDCITKGQNVNDGEDAWTASANVTATADTAVKLRGDESAKLVIAAAFTTGLAAYFNFSAKDLTTETALHFWIYSSIVTAAGDLKIRVSEQNNGGTGATYEDLDVPALAANTWTPCCVAFATPADLNAVLSVGLVVGVDNGAQTVYVDDIRSVDKYTGTADNRWSTGVMNDVFIATNGIDQPQKYAGVVATGFEDLTTTLAAGAITTAELVLIAKGHVVLLNNTENGADAPQRASWTNIDQIQDFINGTAGYQDLTDDESWIVAAAQLSENTWIIYKERSIVKMEWVGGQTPFRFTTMVPNKTCAGKDCVYGVEGIHFVIGVDAAYAYAGEKDVEQIDTAIHSSLFEAIDQTYIIRSFLIWLEKESEIQFWVPTTDEYPDSGYCYNTKDKAWYVRSRIVSGFGFYESSTALTIGDLTMTIGEMNFTIGSTLVRSNTPFVLFCDPDNSAILKSDVLTLNNNGSAIENVYETPDFVYPEGDPEASSFKSFLISQLLVRAKGQSVTTEYSTDEGLTWNPTEAGGNNTITLSSVYAMYQQDFQITVKQIRFRFRNVTASSGFTIDYYAFAWQPRSIR